jgi:hypothetical protein
MLLHLGVLDVPYSNATGVTTGDVAEFIEEKYGLLEKFVEVHEADIADDLAQSVNGSIQSLVAGVQIDPFAAATAQIETRMKRFLTSQEAEQVGLQNVPTQAALKGVNKRLKSKRGARRPSFIDTDLMESSYKVWTTP